MQVLSCLKKLVFRREGISILQPAWLVDSQPPCPGWLWWFARLDVPSSVSISVFLFVSSDLHMGLAVNDYMVSPTQLDPFDGDLPAFVDMPTANDVRVRDIYCLPVRLYDTTRDWATTATSVKIPEDKRCVGSLVVGYLEADIARVSTAPSDAAIRSDSFCKPLI